MSKVKLGQGTKGSSWVRRCKLVEHEMKGRDVLNPVGVRWYETFEAPEIEPNRGDVTYTVQLGDRIDKLAFAFYGDVSLWWVIALANQMDEPAIDLHAGIQITIPSPSYVTGQIAGRRQSLQRGLE